MADQRDPSNDRSNNCRTHFRSSFIHVCEVANEDTLPPASIITLLTYLCVEINDTNLMRRQLKN